MADAQEAQTPSPDPSAPAGPEGSAYEDLHSRRRSRGLRRRLRGWISGLATGIFARTFPHIYYAYCWLVFTTSRVQDGLTGPLTRMADRHGRVVCILWHQEVFTVAYAYRHMHGHTLASTGNLGRVITRMLELCNFTVFRGGSSQSKSRRRRVLVDMIRHMQEEPRVIYGVTVDGSHGPAFRMKRGSAMIAKACGAPLMVVRTWFSWRITLPTWDHMVIPLPFGRIHMQAIGPYWVDPNADEAGFEATCKHLESELLDLADRSFRRYERFPPEGTRPGFPEGWQARWAPDQEGLALGPNDLAPDNPPAYAHRPNSSDLPRPAADQEPSESNDR